MTTDFFIGNRRALVEQLSTLPIILTAYTSLQRTGDASFRFEQEANFWYLTGITAPDWWVICADSKSYLVAPEKSEIHAIFDGSLSAADAQEKSGVDEVLTFAAGKALLSELATRYEKIATIGVDPRKDYYDFSLNPAQGNLRKRIGKLYKETVDCRPALSRLRAIKQPEELDAIRKAIALTAGAFERVKESPLTLKHEYEVEALFDYEFRNANASHAYDPIVAMGINACTLHYGANDQPLVRGLLLLDIGARVDGYAADITRTYRVGQPTEREQTVHDAVVDAQEKIIALLGPGVSVKEYSEQVDVIMKQALESLGLLKIEKDYRKYFPHSVSHGLGIDVHDSLGGPETFQPGMVLTVEPGIYIPEESIGVRIEDDILITETGYENLSGQLSTAL